MAETIEELQNPNLYSEISYNQASNGPAILVRYNKATGEPRKVWYGKIIGKNTTDETIDFREDNEFLPENARSHFFSRELLDGRKKNPASPNYFQLYKKRDLPNLMATSKSPLEELSQSVVRQEIASYLGGKRSRRIRIRRRRRTKRKTSRRRKGTIFRNKMR